MQSFYTGNEGWDLLRNFNYTSVGRECFYDRLLKKENSKFSSTQVGDAEKRIHYLGWEGCLCVYSGFICMVYESEYLPREMNVLYDGLGLDVQNQFFT